MRPLKFKYLWRKSWYFIDLEKDNTGMAFSEFENRAKTSRLYQYTGFNDQYGIEIYENDFVRTISHQKHPPN